MQPKWWLIKEWGQPYTNWRGYPSCQARLSFLPAHLVWKGLYNYKRNNNNKNPIDGKLTNNFKWELCFIVSGLTHHPNPIQPPSTSPVCPRSSPFQDNSPQAYPEQTNNSKASGSDCEIPYSLRHRDHRRFQPSLELCAGFDCFNSSFIVPAHDNDLKQPQAPQPDFSDHVSR